tara:strand:+ start:19881 stop:20621 length:741 start_codon:yes stop_codon:yes gene_type:complete
MDISKLIRKPDAVLPHLTKAKDGSLVAKKETRIYVPLKYRARSLASFGNTTRVIGIFPIVVGNHYSVMKVCANVDLLPTSTRSVIIEGEEYIELFFEAGAVIIKSLNLVQSAILVYYISDHFYSKGDVPWFINYNDLSELFDTAIKHAGTDLNVDPAILEAIAASLSRQVKDRTKYLRHALRSQADFEHPEILGNGGVSYISLKNIELGATNTTAKLMGNYFNDGLSSALVTKSDRLEGVEELLRR